MRDLVRHHFTEGAQLAERRRGIEQQQRVVEDDEAGVLHRATHAGRGQQVEFRERERDAGVALGLREDFRRLAGRELHAGRLAARRDDAHAQRLLAHFVRRRHGFDHVERTNPQCDQVGRQLLGDGEVMHHRAAGGRGGSLG